MAKMLRPVAYVEEETPPMWTFQIIEDDVPGDYYRTMRPGQEGDPTRISLVDQDGQAHDLVFYRPKR